MSLFSFAGTLRLAASKLMCRVGIMSCEGGTCCGGQWHEAESEGTQSSCAEGQIYLRWGPADNCCGCVPAQIFDPRANALVDTVDVKDDLCCPVYEGKWLPFDPITADYIGCLGRCCSDGYCIDLHEVACVSTGRVWIEGRCDPEGCPVDCCAEDSDGNVTCATVDSALLCTTPKVLADPDCATGCLGQCCLDDEEGNPQPQGMMTQEACDAIGGAWQGLGETNCSGCPCRDPFDCSCCESVTSTAAGITFFQPRRKRSPQFTDTFRVTVAGRTESSIYVHGIPVGASCDFEVTFVLCHDSFHIEPVECGTNFKKLTVKVCWEEEHTSGETLEIRGCEHGTIAAGSCRPGGCSGSGDCVSPGAECTTTLLHNENGATTDAAIAAYGRLTIDSSGTGALVLTGDITVSECSMTLVITGTNDDLNRIDGDILQQASTKPVIVEKRGDGTWQLSGNNTYSGQLRVLGGTLVVGESVNGTVGDPSPFGLTGSLATSPVVGDDTPVPGGTAAMLLANDVVVGRLIQVRSSVVGSGQIVALGGYGNGSSVFGGTIRLSGDVTLQAANGGDVTFSGNFIKTTSLIPSITIGSVGNAGTVVLNKFLPSSVPVVVVLGTARLNTDDVIDPAAMATVGSSLGSATLDLNGFSQTLGALAFAGSSGLVTGGTLTIGYSGTAEVDVAGAGHEIASDVTLSDDATFTVDGDADLTVSGVVSGGFAITKEGDGLLELNAANTYSDGTTINGGTARAGDVAAFGTGGITVNAGGTLDKNGFALANTITNNGGTVLN